MKIKKLIYLFNIDTLPDPSNDIIDVLIELEDDKYCTNNFTYVVEVATPQALADSSFNPKLLNFSKFYQRYSC